MAPYTSSWVLFAQDKLARLNAAITEGIKLQRQQDQIEHKKQQHLLREQQQLDQEKKLEDEKSWREEHRVKESVVESVRVEEEEVIIKISDDYTAKQIKSQENPRSGSSENLGDSFKRPRIVLDLPPRYTQVPTTTTEPTTTTMTSSTTTTTTAPTTTRMVYEAPRVKTDHRSSHYR